MTTLKEYREMQDFLNHYDFMKKTINDLNEILENYHKMSGYDPRAALEQIETCLRKVGRLEFLMEHERRNQ